MLYALIHLIKVGKEHQKKKKEEEEMDKLQNIN